MTDNDQTSTSARTLQVGDVLEDGWIFMGPSPDTGIPFSIAAADLSIPDDLLPDLVNHFTAVAKAAEHNGRLMTVEEAKLVYQHKDSGALKGTFDDNTVIKRQWTKPYWLAEEHNAFSARRIHFDTGKISGVESGFAGRVRIVRDEPHLAA